MSSHGLALAGNVGSGGHNLFSFQIWIWDFQTEIFFKKKTLENNERII